jgi:hypothetical protein
MARPTAGGSGTRTTLVPRAAHAQHPVAVLLTQAGDVRAGGLEDPQARQAEHGRQREVIPVRRLAGGGEQGPELQAGEPGGG